MKNIRQLSASLLAFFSLLMLTAGISFAEGSIPVIVGGTPGLQISGTMVTGYTGTSPVVEIPEGVTYISDYAFDRCIDVTSVRLPSTLKSVGSFGMANMHSLKTLELPEGLETIGMAAFAGSGMERVVLPSTLTKLDANAFYGCPYLTYVYIPKSVTYFGDAVFSECDQLVDVVIEDGLTSLGYGTDGENLFAFCDALERVVLPDSISNMEAGTFFICPNLKEVVLPNELKVLPVQVFSSCESLTSVRMPAKIKTILDPFNDCRSLKTLYIPEGAEALPSGFHASGLEHLYLPESVAYIAGGYIANAENLTVHCFEYSYAESWALSNGLRVELMDHQSFSSLGGNISMSNMTLRVGQTEQAAVTICPDSRQWNKHYQVNAPLVATVNEQGLVTAHKPGTVQLTLTIDGISASCIITVLPAEESGSSSDFITYANTLIKYNGTAENVVVPDGIVSISEGAFSANPYIQTVVLPDSVTYLGARAFTGCSQLRKVTLPANLQHILKDTFLGCASLEEVPLPAMLQGIGEQAFYQCFSLRKIDLPDSLTSIGAYAFYECSLLKDLKIPTNVQTMGMYAFGNCVSLEGPITIPPAITELAPNLFENCVHLSQINLHSGVKVIGHRSLSNCGFVELNLPYGVEKLGVQALAGCHYLKSVYIPDSVTRIEQGLFEACDALESYRIPDHISIDTYSMFDSSNMEVITFPEGITTLASTPDTCPNLTRIVLPSTLQQIEGYCITNNPKLEEIILPEGVASIGDCAFINNISLKRIYIPGSVTSIGADILSLFIAHEEDHALPTVFCPQGSAAEAWAMENGYPVHHTNTASFSAKGGKIELDAGLCVGQGQTLKLAPSVFPEAAGFTPVFSSSDPSVLIIDAAGMMTGIKQGTARITMTIDDVSASANVSVYAPVTDFNLSATQLTLMIKETACLSAIGTAPAGSSEKLVFSSLKPSVVSVDANGTLTAKAFGTAIIRVSSASGVQRECTVQVIPNVERISFDQPYYQMNPGEVQQLQASVICGGTVYQNQFITFASSDPSVATVDASGVVTMYRPGVAVISAVSRNRACTASCAVVSGSNSAEMTLNVTDAVLSVSSPGNRLQLVCASVPASQVVTWLSTNPASVAVDSNGLIHAVAPGTATIFVTTGTSFALCEVQVRHLNTLSLPVHLATVEDEAFFGNENLELVLLPHGATAIGKFAFAQCDNLRYVVIPDTVQLIGEGAFTPGAVLICSPASMAWQYAQTNGFSCQDP